MLPPFPPLALIVPSVAMPKPPLVLERAQAVIFQDGGPGGVHDWSTGDWMSTKVLGPYATRHPRRGLATYPAQTSVTRD